jgi:hypothetical protein
MDGGEDAVSVETGVETEGGRWAVLDDRGRFVCSGFDLATVLATLEECREIAASGRACGDCGEPLLRCACPDV